MDDATYVSVTTDDGFDVSTNSETEADLRSNLAVTPAVDHDDAEADADAPRPKKAATAAIGDADTDLDEDAQAGRERNADGTFKAKPTDAAAVAEPETPKAGKPRDDPHARVKQATAKEAEAKRERDEARAEAARYRAELDAARAPKPDAATPDPKPVTAAAFADYPEWASSQADGANTSYEKYLDERQDWRWTQKEQAAAAQAETDRRAQASAKAHASWQTRLDTFRTATPDWDQRFKPDTPIDTRIQAYLKAQADGPAIVLYLSDHQDLAQRIATLHPIDQIGEIGKIQARLEAASPSGPAPTQVASHAKAPIKPLAASPSIAEPDEGSDDEPIEKFIERENRRERKAGRR